MKYPSSTRFQNISVGIMPEGPFKGRPVLCGEMSGKSSEGTYGRFTRVMASDFGDEDGAFFMYAPPLQRTVEEAIEDGEKCKSAVRRVQGKHDPIMLEEAKLTCTLAQQTTRAAQDTLEFNTTWQAICKAAPTAL